MYIGEREDVIWWFLVFSWAGPSPGVKRCRGKVW